MGRSLTFFIFNFQIGWSNSADTNSRWRVLMATFSRGSTAVALVFCRKKADIDSENRELSLEIIQQVIIPLILMLEFFFCGFCKVIFFSNKPQDIETGQSSPLPGSTRLPPSDVAGSNPACECECGDGLFAGWTVAVCGRKGFFMVTHVVSSVHSWIQWDIMGI